MKSPVRAAARSSAVRALAALLLAVPACAAVAAERLVVGAAFSRVFEQAPNGEWTGLGVDIVRALAARAGDTVRFQLYPWPRAQAMVAQGQADILVGAYKSPERAARFAFLDHPFYRDRMVFFARAGAGAAVWAGDYGALKQVPIAAVRGWHYGENFDQARSGLQLSEVPRLENGARMLLLGRVALLAANERNLQPVLAQLNIVGRVAEQGPALSVQDGYLAFPRQPRHQPAQRRYNQLFTEMLERGELGRMARKHLVQVP
ncbi:substrate-binding periplasmic protein [Duganella aceris]|uniref:Amino acid ABC transporter substrate-binding protein n=1 Tax=Duganella aceris TaxID=2703883 RepID=A0ABX0FUH3_9BURK|nr:transporter substrate-binding domain-containing protein [Duganella aceris]NGZ88353.1 amino acid ABC transporter substrate-binding protein [Duganella aceris]